MQLYKADSMGCLGYRQPQFNRRDGKSMISTYKFGKIEDMDSFRDGVNNILYFPVKDSVDFPQAIRDKAEEMIDGMIHAYKLENDYGLDSSGLCLNARIIAFVGKEGNWSYEIAVVISGNLASDDVWIEDSHTIGVDSLLYGSFKVYFMEQLGKSLFKSVGGVLPNGKN